MNKLLEGPNGPIIARAAPFFIFVILTSLQGYGGPTGTFWMYGIKTALGALMLWLVYPYVKEMRWRFSVEGLFVGVCIAALWIGLDPYYPKLMKRPDEGWNPHHVFGTGSELAWFFVVVRLIGVTLVVPPLEEAFYRSFVYRYIAKPDFQSIPLQGFRWMPFVVTSVLFGLVHAEWLAGIICGAAYQALVCWKGRLGDAILAHATTNFLLGLWVINRPAWYFW